MRTLLRDRVAELLPEPEQIAISSDDAHRIAADFGTTYPAVKRALWALVERNVAGVDECGFYLRHGRT
jgi:hypothetical protein